MARLRTRPHPILTFLAFLILGPYLAAAALIVLALAAVLYLVGGVVWLTSGRRIV